MAQEDYAPKGMETLESPADSHFLVVKDNDNDLEVLPRCLFIGGGGDIRIRDRAGKDVTYTVQAGQILPFRPVRVLATGTTATNIVAWY